MPLLSCFTPLGQLELSSQPSLFQRVYESIVANLGGQYDLTSGSHNEATVYARARAIARGMQAQRRAGNNAYPLKCLELLPLQEEGYGLVPGETDSILTRQQALAARMLLSRGATRENIETQLRAILGDAFLAYRTLTMAEVTAWPTDPSLGPGNFTRIDTSAVPKYVRFLDPVVALGAPLLVHYAPMQPNDAAAILTPGDTLVVQLENLGLAERVTVGAVGIDATGRFFTATFTKSHDVAASGIVGDVPVWCSTARFALIVATAAAAQNAELHRRVDDLMVRVTTGFAQWALVQPTTPGASTIGPFTLNVSPLGAATVAQLSF